MKLTKRLQALANMAKDAERIFDIGCDHGILSVFFALQGKKVIASDLREAPLNSAKALAKKYQVEEKIAFYLCDGIPKIEKKENDFFILAGMGAHTILHILEENIEGTFVIQSNNDLPYLREEMQKKGYQIIEEKAVFDKKWYVFIKFQVGDAIYTKEDFAYGPFLKKDKEYMTYLYEKKKKIYERSKQEQQLEEIKTIQKLIEKCSG